MNFYIAREPPALDTLGRSLQLSNTAFGLPGLKCDLCGRISAWDASRLHKSLPVDSKLRRLSRWPLPTSEFAVVAEQARQELSLPADYLLLPGMNFGPVRVEVIRGDIPNFEWPGLSSLIITEQVLDTFVQKNLSGWCAEPVEVTRWRKLPKERTKPLLYELVVTGSAGIAHTNPFFPALSVCSLCGRTEYGNTNDLDCFTANVSEKEWDGSDFCRFDGLCWGYHIVTERVKAVIEAASLTNIEFVSLPSSL